MASDNKDVVATQSAHEEGGSTLAADCFVEREILPHRDVAEYKRLHPNTLDARRFKAMFNDERNSTMFDRLEVCRDTNIGARSRRWASAWLQCAGIMDSIGRFKMRLVWHAEKVTYARALCWKLSEAERD